jgi:hypothetical protein
VADDIVRGGTDDITRRCPVVVALLEDIGRFPVGKSQLFEMTRLA